MGLFDTYYASCDWNHDGKIDRTDNLIELYMLQQLNEDMDREQRIKTVVRAITEDGKDKTLGNREFEILCEENGLDINDFTQSDITEIQRRLNSWGRY